MFKSRTLFAFAFSFFLISFFHAESSASASSYLDWDTFKYVRTKVYGVPVLVEYCCDVKDSYKSEKSKWKGQPVSRTVYFRSYELGDGEPGSDEYIITKHSTILEFPYHSEAEKHFAMEKIKEEGRKIKEQERRIAEDKKLNPERVEYRLSGEVDFSELDSLDSPSLRFPEGSILLAKSMYLYGAEYIIKTSGRKFMYMARPQLFRSSQSYDFLLANVSDLSSSENYVKYLGIVELVNSNDRSSKKIFEKWEIVFGNPLVGTAIKNNPLNYAITEDDIKVADEESF